MIDTLKRAPPSSLRLSAALYGAHALACRHEERGFALITVLWLITALAALVGHSIGATRLGNQATTNRIVLARGRWAAEACQAIVQARWAQHHLADTATIDLGRGVRCSWSVDDPSSRIDINAADPEVLRALGLREGFVLALLAHRREARIEDLGQIIELPGFDSGLVNLSTAQGSGSVNLSSAPRRVLLALPGLTTEAVERILYRRIVGRPLTSIDALAAELSPPARVTLMRRYADLVRLATFRAPRLVVRAEGWVEGFVPRATIEHIIVPLPDRLAVVGRRMW
ncbi:MAG: hypothetical protein ACRDKS_16280 [Actinomycetota bacterium]